MRGLAAGSQGALCFTRGWFVRADVIQISEPAEHLPKRSEVKKLHRVSVHLQHRCKSIKLQVPQAYLLPKKLVGVLLRFGAM